jgi:hypothetical protein
VATPVQREGADEGSHVTTVDGPLAVPDHPSQAEAPRIRRGLQILRLPMGGILVLAALWCPFLMPAAREVEIPVRRVRPRSLIIVDSAPLGVQNSRVVLRNGSPLRIADVP